MTEPTTKTTVFKALNAVMNDVQSIAKDRKVTEGPAKFNFRGVDDVVNAVGPRLREHGVLIIPSRIISLETERYQTKSGSHMHATIIELEFEVYGPEGDCLPKPIAAAGQAADSGDKSVSKASSVAYRNALLQALCIPTDQPDPDEEVHERAAETPPEDPNERKSLWEEAVAIGVVKGKDAAAMQAAFLAGYKVPVITASINQLKDFIERTKKLPDGGAKAAEQPPLEGA